MSTFWPLQYEQGFLGETQEKTPLKRDRPGHAFLLFLPFLPVAWNVNLIAGSPAAIFNHVPMPSTEATC